MSVVNSGGTLRLRDLPTSARLFWKETQYEQYHAGATDMDSHGDTFELYKNAVTAMALNEYSAQDGRGFFYFLKSSLAWKKTKKDTVCPESRLPGQPGPDYPGLIYIDYTWTASSRDKFVNRSQRSRYLACDALINLPAKATPLYLIQYACNQRYPLYITPKETIIAIATPERVYVGLSSQIEKAVGRWSDRSYKPPNANVRLNTTPFLWTESSVVSKEHAAARNKKTGKRNDAEVFAALAPFGIEGIAALHEAVVRTCRPETLAATCTVRELSSVIPRPLNPEAGVALGTILGVHGTSWETSNPKTRRGERRPARGDKPRVGSRDREDRRKTGDGSLDSPWEID
ncbi:MAG: hypothetical protein Q9226_007387 [Calogaya cf. arnoldii]